MNETLSRNDPRRREPLFNRFPPVLIWLGGAIALVSMLQLFGPPGMQHWLLRAGAIITGAGAGPHPPRPLGLAAPYVLHVFLHGGLLHLFINLGALIAFGPPVAEALGRGFRGTAGFLIFFFICAACGAAGQVIAAHGQPGIAVGASSALSGVLAAAGYARSGWSGAVRIGGPWLLINVVLAMTTLALSIPIAWAAHIGGLCPVPRLSGGRRAAARTRIIAGLSSSASWRKCPRGRGAGGDGAGEFMNMPVRLRHVRLQRTCGMMRKLQ